MIQLRDVEDEDFEYFKCVWRDKDLIALTSGDFNNYTDEEFRKWFNNKSSTISKIICLGDKIIGDINLSCENDGWYELAMRIASEQNRGKGYGSQALEQVINLAKHQKINRIFLEVRPDNNRAINLFGYIS